jgi:antitoxin component YwqK of YwqJK toxin-antitoxin module
MIIEARADDGRLLSTATVGPDGVLNGEFVAYDIDGAPQMRMIYRAGLPHGPATAFQGGRVQSEMTYVAGVLDGEMRNFDPAGRLVSVVRHANGRRHGTMECFSITGTTLLTAGYKDGRLDGLLNEFRPDGTLRHRASYKADLLHGDSVEFHPGGQPAMRVVYQAGVPVQGPERFPDPDAPGRASPLAWLMDKVSGRTDKAGGP